jgi:ubiquinone/menaquinone biosynthesis C-methylase UbiE
VIGKLAGDLEIQFYDAAVPDWPGEIDFYRAMTAKLDPGASILELGCGTGRVTLQLAREGLPVMGLDVSASMLAMARQKGQGLPNVRWAEGDMRAFELGERFELILIPGHSYQFMLTPTDQVACLTCIRRHLALGGRLVVHLDHQQVDWLGGLMQAQGTAFRLVGDYRQNSSDGWVRKWVAWSYEASSQTASAVTAWEIVGQDMVVKERTESARKRLHCVFRFEMEHLLARAGFEVEALYGDFYRQELQDTSSEMIWVARARQDGTH